MTWDCFWIHKAISYGRKVKAKVRLSDFELQSKTTTCINGLWCCVHCVAFHALYFFLIVIGVLNVALSFFVHTFWTASFVQLSQSICVCKQVRLAMILCVFHMNLMPGSPKEWPCMMQCSLFVCSHISFEWIDLSLDVGMIGHNFDQDGDSSR